MPEPETAIIHPTGTGKSFIAFQLALDNQDKRICWLSPSEYIFRTQLENLANANGGAVPENISFYTYAKLPLLSEEDVEKIQPDYITWMSSTAAAPRFGGRSSGGAGAVF